MEGKEDKAVNVEIITPKKLKDITLSYKQMIVLLEALYNFRESVIRLKEDNFENFEKQSVYNHKISEINTLFDYLQEGMKYDFEGMVNKCLNKWIKEKDDDPGMETFGWLQEKKEE
ncbi:hypothetical protein KY55_01275 [Clostridium tetani]|nr:hypothetical protein KY55_01275 [Clostridium tetani]